MNKLTPEQKAISKIKRRMYITEWQRKRRAVTATNNTNKIQCEVCGLWYRKVGSHVWQVHGILAREYRQEYGFDIKRGQLPEPDRMVMHKHVFENGTVNNLKAGKKFWFKKGSKTAGRYQRSQQTLERLHRGTRGL